MGRMSSLSFFDANLSLTVRPGVRRASVAGLSKRTTAEQSLQILARQRRPIFRLEWVG